MIVGVLSTLKHELERQCHSVDFTKYLLLYTTLRYSYNKKNQDADIDMKATYISMVCVLVQVQNLLVVDGQHRRENQANVQSCQRHHFTKCFF